MTVFNFDDRARVTYNAFRDGFDNDCPVPDWDDAPDWVRDVARVSYAQGTLDGSQRKSSARIEALEAALRDVIMEFDNAPGELVWQSIARARAALDKDATNDPVARHQP